MGDKAYQTPLHDWHTSHGADMVNFSGWRMPLWYPSGAVTEHRAVVTDVGMFDTSHMSVVMVEGPDAFELLQRCFTRDLRSCGVRDDGPLNPGESVFGAFLNEVGETVDDSVVFRMAPEKFMVVVNAGMGATIALHLEAHKRTFDVNVTDMTGRVGKIDLQGPLSAKVLQRGLKSPNEILGDMRYFTFKGSFVPRSEEGDACTIGGIPVIVSRTGFSGEFGFEVLVDANRLVEVWEAVLGAGGAFGLIPCGLAARDSLRTGAVLPLSHQDMGPWPFINNPWDFVLPFNSERTAFTKSFVGEVVLQLRAGADHTLPFVGNDPRKVAIHNPAVVIDKEGREIGVVLTCVADMAIGRHSGRIYSTGSPDKPHDFKPLGLSCGFVKVKSRLSAGEVVELRDRRRGIKVTIVDDIRPDRTARRPMWEMMDRKESLP